MGSLSNVVNRSTMMFVLGAIGFLHELLRGGTERPFVLALSGALMGLPFVLAADQRFGSRKDDPQEGQEERWSHLP